MDGEQPCIKSWYKKCYVKQYNKKGKVLRSELCVNNPYELGIKRSIVNVGYLGRIDHRITGRYLDSRLGIDVRFLTRHNLAKLAKTEQRAGKRITGIRKDDQRIMGVIEALVHSSNLVSHFTNKSLRKEVHRIRTIGEDGCGSAKMGYD